MCRGSSGAIHGAPIPQDREREALVKHQGDDALDDSAAARLGVRGLQRQIGLRPLAVAYVRRYIRHARAPRPLV